MAAAGIVNMFLGLLKTSDGQGNLHELVSKANIQDQYKFDEFRMVLEPLTHFYKSWHSHQTEAQFLLPILRSTATCCAGP